LLKPEYTPLKFAGHESGGLSVCHGQLNRRATSCSQTLRPESGSTLGYDPGESLDTWLTSIVSDCADNILPLDHEVAQVWGRLLAPHPENAFDKQIAATALIHDLTLVTRNVRHFDGTGVRLFNPFKYVS
jgi:hypothetical protein